jgi:hypothetical protein
LHRRALGQAQVIAAIFRIIELVVGEEIDRSLESASSLYAIVQGEAYVGEAVALGVVLHADAASAASVDIIDLSIE